MVAGQDIISQTTFQYAKSIGKEGIKVKNDTIVYFKKVFWDPSEELL